MEIRTEAIVDVEVNIICERCHNELNCVYDRNFDDIEVQFCEHCKNDIFKKINDISEITAKVIKNEDFAGLKDADDLLEEIKDIVY